MAKRGPKRRERKDEEGKRARKKRRPVIPTLKAQGEMTLTRFDSDLHLPSGALIWFWFFLDQKGQHNGLICW